MSTVKALNDDELIRLVQQDDEQAFAAIYDRYWQELFISARRIVESRDIAQDAVQEVFISLWKRRAGLEVSYLRHWLYQAVRFQVFKAIRHDKVDRKVKDKLARVTMDIVSHDPIRFRELQQLITRIIDALPEDQAEFFRMSRDEGKTYREIAEEKNVSVKTVEKKMSAALKEINTRLGDPLTILLILHILSSHPN